MRVISLGSGSSGNALVVLVGREAVLVDAGFAVRTLVSRLRQVGVAPEALTGICLTHEHSDHARGAVGLARQYGIPLIGDPRTLAAVLRAAENRAEATMAPEREELPVGQARRVGALEVRSFAISHDAVAPCGFVLASSAWRVCVVTDTGMPTEPMVEALREAHLLVLEANHDRMRLLNGPYPHYLKMRILSPTGHLSNEQTCQTLARVLDDGPRWVWLAHLSKTNNTPDLASACVGEHLRTLGLRHLVPVPLPREVGPAWDSGALWGNTTERPPQPAAAAMVVATITPQPRE
ncbi:MAG: MBL fold metallo-hydrolase [Ktedonobacterales bacterium]|nr:MBL fold metallo-hydrolase [Ktedonobacterales bacterium]